MENTINKLNSLIESIPDGFKNSTNHIITNTDKDGKPTVDGVVIVLPTEIPNVNVAYKIDTEGKIETLSTPSSVDLSMATVVDLAMLPDVYTDIYNLMCEAYKELIMICLKRFVENHEAQIAAAQAVATKLFPQENVQEQNSSNVVTVDAEEVEDTEKPKKTKKVIKTSKKKVTKKD